MLVFLADGRPALVDLKADGVKATTVPGLDRTRPLLDVTFEGAVSGDKIGGTCRTQFGNFQFSGDRG